MSSPNKIPGYAYGDELAYPAANTEDPSYSILSALRDNA